MGVFRFKPCSVDRFSFFQLTALWVLVLSACASVPPAEQMQPPVQPKLSAESLLDGSVLLVEIDLGEHFPGAPPSRVTGRFDDREFVFFPVSGAKKSRRYQALVGIPYLYDPGPASVQVNADGREFKLGFTVVAGDWPSETLSVDPDKVKPPESAMPRIIAEVKEIKAVYANSEEKKYWNGKFSWPIRKTSPSSPDSITSAYGNKRLYNGQMRSYHSGVDLRASVGTPIRAPAGGRVALAKDLYFTGNTVILDHGYGLFTLYAHLSKLRVKKGQVVHKNQLLGLAGATGRVTGPHLHWGALVHRVKVNPLELMKVIQ